MAHLTVIRLFINLEIVIFALYGKFSTRMSMALYSTHDVGFVSEMESRLGVIVVDLVVWVP